MSRIFTSLICIVAAAIAVLIIPVCIPFHSIIMGQEASTHYAVTQGMITKADSADIMEQVRAHPSIFRIYRSRVFR